MFSSRIASVRNSLPRFSLALVAFVGITTTFFGCSERADDGDAISAEFVGRRACVKCHATEYNLWRDSHHDLAMDIASDSTVLGDFSGATLDHDRPEVIEPSIELCYYLAVVTE